MGFRNRIVKLSQLTADKVIGATLATAESGVRIVMDTLGVGFAGKPSLRFSTGRGDELREGYITVSTTSGVMSIGAPALGSGPNGPAVNLRDDMSADFDTDVAGHPGAEVDALASTFFKVLSRIELPKLDGGSPGPVLEAINWGFFSGAVDASGRLVVTHNLGVIPSFVVFVCTTAPWHGRPGVVPVTTTTTVRITVRDTTTNAAAALGTVIDGFWLAIG